MCHVNSLRRKYTLVAYREIFERGGRDDCSTGSTHTTAVEEVPLAATHAPGVVGGRAIRRELAALLMASSLRRRPHARSAHLGTAVAQLGRDRSRRNSGDYGPSGTAG